MLESRTNNRTSTKIGPLKAITFIVLWSFLFNLFVHDLAWAARKSLELSGFGSERVGSPGSSLAIESMLDEAGIEADEGTSYTGFFSFFKYRFG